MNAAHMRSDARSGLSPPSLVRTGAKPLAEGLDSWGGKTWYAYCQVVYVYVWKNRFTKNNAGGLFFKEIASGQV